MKAFLFDIRFVCTYKGLFKTLNPHYTAVRTNKQSQDAWIAFYNVTAKKNRQLSPC